MFSETGPIDRRHKFPFDTSDKPTHMSTLIISPYITSYGSQSWFSSCPPGQNGHHFADDIFRCIFVNEKFCIFIKISLKFVPKGPIDNNPALVQIMAWHQIGNKPLSEPLLTRFTDTYIYAALGGDELTQDCANTSALAMGSPQSFSISNQHNVANCQKWFSQQYQNYHEFILHKPNQYIDFNWRASH